MKVPPLLKLIAEIVTVRKLLFNRITLTVLVLLIAGLALQGYVAANSTGVIEGTVVDEDGEPMENVSVEIQTVSFGAVNENFETRTDENGEFRFEDMEMMEFRLYVERDGEVLVEERHHLYFEGQRTEIRVVVE